MAAEGSKRRVGVVGFGHLGEYLVRAIVEDEAVAAQLELAFVWNRTAAKVRDSPLVPAEAVLEDLSDFKRFGADLIVEVAHPDITRAHGAAFAAAADYFVGSPTVFADASVENAVRDVANAKTGFGVYVPAGALWGAQDIAKMASRGNLAALSVTMKKHPSSLAVHGSIAEARDKAVADGVEGDVVLYEGPVRDLCPLAPNNVNTMAAAALAAHNLGFDRTIAKLVCNSSLQAHVIVIDAKGPKREDGTRFSVSTQRVNPAASGAVTGSATYASFLSSMLLARGKGDGVHLV